MRKYFIVTALLLCFVLVFSGCGKATPKPSETLPVTNENVQEVPEQPPVEQSAEVTIGSPAPFTGMTIETEQIKLRPLAIMIDNMASARPQSGLQSADIVYEMPAEGGITRYMAIYQSQQAEKIGPVRSARSYFIDKAMELNAVYIHCGGSPEALKDIEAFKVDSLNELKGEKNFWRARDRKAPHNLYTSTKLADEVMETKKLKNEKWSSPFLFSSSYLDLDGKTVSKISMNYEHNYKAGYEYNSTDKRFYRTINGIRLKDKETGVEISTVNIIVEKVKTQVLDKVGRLGLSNTGSGRGYLITGGKLVEIQWEKKDRQAQTKYTDLKGNPIQLNKGNTWIQVLPDYATIEFKE